MRIFAKIPISRMHAIIPVAGVGTRLRPHTYTLPKVLLNVAGKPILGHILDRVIAAGVTSVTIVVGYLGDLVEEYVTTEYKNLQTNFVVQEEPLGLGHSIWVAREHIPTNGDPLFIILGDTIFDVDLKTVFSLPSSALCVKEVEDPRRFGVAEVENGYIARLVEKPEHPTTNLAVVGLYWIRNAKLLKECLEEIVDKNIRTRNEYQLTDALQMMIDRGERFATFPIDAWYDCGKPETMLDTNRHLLKQKGLERTIDGVVVVPPVYIAPTATISNSIIGPFATIGEDATVKNSIVRDSIIGDHSVALDVLLSSSIIGSGASISDGFKSVNVGDSSEIKMQG